MASNRSETPRLVTISANHSSTSIPPLNYGVQIDREVVVTSHTRHPGRRASYSPISLVSGASGHLRTQSQELRGPSVNRWDPRLSERSMRQQSRWSIGRKRTEHMDTNRESMKALAEFLMTKEPPPTNWISTVSDDERSLRTIKKFNVFGSLKKKKKKSVPKSPKFLKLPDSAVAALTLKGCRHIAISIPLEHDYPEIRKPSVGLNIRPKSAPGLYGSDKGAVTVLKPVVEVRESSSFPPPLTNGYNSAESGRIRGASVPTPPIEILGVEATRTLERYYRQLQQQQCTSTEEKRPETSRERILAGDTSMAPPRVNPRDSIGTIYTTLVMSTPGHSRNYSSPSASPAVIPFSGLRLDPPTRGSSKSTIPVPIEHELKVESARVAAFELERKRQVQKSSSPSLKSDSSLAPTIFGTATAESARAYSSPGLQYFSRSNTPLASSTAPTKKLPDLPRGADGQVIRPSTAPLSKSNSSNSQRSTKRPSSVKDNTAELVKAPQQSRQERVKARKLRDLAALQGKADDFIPSTPQVVDLAPKTSRSSKHKSSGHSSNKRNLNRMSQIMLVANLAPFTGTVPSSVLPSPSTRRLLSNQPSSTSTPTPPRSLHDVDFASDSDTIPSPPRTSRTASSTSPNRALDVRRQERRTKRNTMLHEKELDARLSKIEKDNQVLLSTLRDIAASFGQLGRLLPSEVEEVGMEPLMRELSGGAEGRERVEVR